MTKPAFVAILAVFIASLQHQKVCVSLFHNNPRNFLVHYTLTDLKSLFPPTFSMIQLVITRFEGPLVKCYTTYALDPFAILIDLIASGSKQEIEPPSGT